MKKIEVLSWSIAFPGFGQLLNNQIYKGLVFIMLVVIINTKSHFNQAILYSFNGEIQKAIDITNYQWLMFYPCIYMLSIWDAYRNASHADSLSYLPMTICGFSVTIGLMFSTRFHLFGLYLGPLWTPILFSIPGTLSGVLIKRVLMAFHRKKISKQSESCTER